MIWDPKEPQLSQLPQSSHEQQAASASSISKTSAKHQNDTGAQTGKAWP